MRRLCYIAGPFAAPTPAEIARNVRRAAALARHASASGLSPIVPHVMGMAGCYGPFNGTT